MSKSIQQIKLYWSVKEKVVTAGLQKIVRNYDSKWSFTYFKEFDLLTVTVQPSSDSDCITFDSDVFTYNSNYIIIPFKDQFLVKINSKFSYKSIQQITEAAANWRILVAWGCPEYFVKYFMIAACEARGEYNEVEFVCGRPGKCCVTHFA